MKKRFLVLISVLFFIIIVSILFIRHYKKPKEYFISDCTVTMCDESGKKLIAVEFELYLHRYLFKGAELHGSIFVDGERYTSVFDMEQFMNYAKAYADNNGFMEKMEGEIRIAPFASEVYWSEHTPFGVLSKKCIRDLNVNPSEGVFVFAIQEDGSDTTLYLGPASNAVEYEKIMQKSYDSK